jgi:type VI secretion system secreted protein VgrG
MKRFTKHSVVLLLVVAFVMGITGQALAATSPSLGTAGSYSVLGHTTVTNTGGTTMPGDLGISIGGAPTGFPPGSVGPPGSIRNAGDSLAAQNANTATFLALNAAPNVTCDANYGAGPHELAGSTLTPGIYCADAFQLSGTLYLDALGNPDAVWIFRTALSTLNTSAGVNASVQFSGDVSGSPCNVWWQVASSATIGSGTSFIGNILALTSISMGTGASLNGRALAQTGAVTLNTNTFTGAACLSASTYASNTTATTTPATVVPKFPNTGVAPTNKSVNSWSYIIPAGLVIALFSLYVARKKQLI